MNPNTRKTRSTHTTYTHRYIQRGRGGTCANLYERETETERDTHREKQTDREIEKRQTER